jgi:hypothetical protein
MLTNVWNLNDFHVISVLSKGIKFNVDHCIADGYIPLGKWRKTQVGRTDARGRYEFSSGRSYHDLVDLNGAAPTAQFVFSITKLAEYTLVAKMIGCMKCNRWVKRRMPNTYCWLDEHRLLIGREMMATVFRQAKAEASPEEKSQSAARLWIKPAN